MVLGHKKDVSRLSQYLTLQLLSGDQVSAGAGPFCTTGCITTLSGQHVRRYARMYVHTLHDVYLDVCVCVCGDASTPFSSAQANEVQAEGHFGVLGQ